MYEAPLETGLTHLFCFLFESSNSQYWLLLKSTTTFTTQCNPKSFRYRFSIAFIFYPKVVIQQLLHSHVHDKKH